MSDPADSSRRYTVAPLLGGIELLSARYRQHAFSPHAQDSYVLGTVESGDVSVTAEGRELVLRPGQILFITPGVIHSAHAAAAAPWDYRAVYLSKHQWDQLGGAHLTGSARNGTGSAIVAETPFAEQLRELHAVLELLPSRQRGMPPVGEAAPEPPATQFLPLIQSVTAACAAAVHAPVRELSIPARLERVRCFLNLTNNRRVTLDELAILAGMSRFSLVREFSRAYGLPPYAYALQSRLLQARRLLASGKGISEVALELGFADQSHLTRWFLRAVGVTPGEFIRGR